MNTTTLPKPSIGIPYAMNCEKCYRAVICPLCGEHIPQGSKGHAYQQHFGQQHAEDPRQSGPFGDKRIGC